MKRETVLKHSCLLLLMLLFWTCSWSQSDVDTGKKQKGCECAVEKVDSFTYRYRTNTQNTHQEGLIKLLKETDSLFTIQHIIDDSIVSKWIVPYPVYRFDCGDITGDGIPEIFVGPVKKTRYHHVKARRLFIYYLKRGKRIDRLWMGSRVGEELDDFCVERDSVPAFVHTWEHTAEGKQIETAYVLQGFGLKFFKYLKR